MFPYHNTDFNNTAKITLWETIKESRIFPEERLSKGIKSMICPTLLKNSNTRFRKILEKYMPKCYR